MIYSYLGKEIVLKGMIYRSKVDTVYMCCEGSNHSPWGEVTKLSVMKSAVNDDASLQNSTQFMQS